MTKLKDCTRAELDAFVLTYPGTLARGVYTISDPPCVYWEDTARNEIVARYWVDTRPGPKEGGWRILAAID